MVTVDPNGAARATRKFDGGRRPPQGSAGHLIATPDSSTGGFQQPMSSTARPPYYRPFRVDVLPARDHVRVVPVGELDMATVPELEQQLRELEDAGFAQVVLDLRELDFLDSSGIRLIVTSDRFARSNGHDFTLIEGNPAIQRTLRVSGADELLSFRRPA